MTYPIRTFLKDRTATLHARSEESFERKAPIETPEGLRHFLGCMLEAHLKFRGAFDRSAELAGLPPKSDTLIAALLSDTGRGRDAEEKASSVPSDDAACLGVGYVFEGSALGAGILRKRLKRAGIATPEYLELMADTTKSRWPRYVEALDTCAFQGDAVLKGAEMTFNFIVTESDNRA